MNTGEKFQGRPEDGRQISLEERHWWKKSPWPFLAPLIEAGLPEADLRRVWERVAFFYEAQARFEAPEGCFRWAMGKPFGSLTLLEVGEATKAFSEVERWTLNSASSGEPLTSPPGEWSRPLQINLRATWEEVAASFKPWFETEQKNRGVKKWRRQIPWDGLEAFDYRLDRLSYRENAYADRKAIQRARECWQDRHF